MASACQIISAPGLIAISIAVRLEVLLFLLGHCLPSGCIAPGAKVAHEISSALVGLFFPFGQVRIDMCNENLAVVLTHCDDVQPAIVGTCGWGRDVTQGPPALFRSESIRGFRQRTR
jgi:hypothetical protein